MGAKVVDGRAKPGHDGEGPTPERLRHRLPRLRRPHRHRGEDEDAEEVREERDGAGKPQERGADGEGGVLVRVER
jgi:hypothetical protein